MAVRNVLLNTPENAGVKATGSSNRASRPTSLPTFKDPVLTPTKKVTYSGSSGSSGSSGGGSYSSGDSSSSIASLYAQLLAQQQAARKAAYDSTVAAQQKNYQYNVDRVNEAANRALQDAYINKMGAQRTMGQEMSAQGLGGTGTSETTLASLLNNYGNSRTSTENNRAAQIASLGNTLQNNIANAQNILTTGSASDMGQYATNLANLAAVNGTSGLNLSQNGSGNTSNPLWYEYLQKILENSGNTTA